MPRYIVTALITMDADTPDEARAKADAALTERLGDHGEAGWHHSEIDAPRWQLASVRREATLEEVVGKPVPKGGDKP